MYVHPERLLFCDEHQHPLPCHIQTLALWPDNSLRSIQAHLCTPLTGELEQTFYLTSQVNRPLPNKLIQYEGNTLTVATATHSIVLDEHGITHRDWQLQFELALASSSSVSPLGFHKQTWRVLFDQTGLRETPLKTIVERYYQLTLPDQLDDLQIVETVVIDQVQDQVTIDVRLHNPNRAEHPNGQWDLGDPNSVWIAQFGYLCQQNRQPHSDGWAELYIEDEQVSLNTGIQQTCSGGQNWDSVAHVHFDNAIDLTAIEHLPARPSPTLCIQGDTQWQVTISKFWQKFPSGITAQTAAEESGVRLDFALPSLHRHQELQPGECWSRQISLNAQTEPAQVALHVHPEWVANSKAIERFVPNTQTSDWHQLLLTPEQWLTKRETVDLFGFRHFGELFADHESTQLPPGEHLVSVYNNQYDPLAGFLKLWLSTGENAYFELADALAKHILDIDIYHTQRDKPEYAGGLFWHTDHYVPAHTSTHRTYSKLQPQDVYMDHAGGGGPGGQHCYTEGLTLYYLLTGNSTAKDAVFQLQAWMSCIYDGDNTLFGLLLAYKNRHRADLKNITTGRYPFDRGTANYVNACLDRFVISSQSQYLDQAIHIIMHTCSPEDDIAQRQLDDIENTWFYVVMLQAVARCHRILSSDLPGRVSECGYCFATLIHYGQYLKSHASLTLEHADQLEYPNDTWTAQDLRKVDVLRYLASISSTATQASYIECADSLESAIFNKLKASDETHFTRIQALLMQNWPVDYAHAECKKGPLSDESQPVAIDAKQLGSVAACTVPAGAEKAKSLSSLDFLANWSIQTELNNLKKRSQRLAQWIP
jgi:hypothetical protein